MGRIGRSMSASLPSPDHWAAVRALFDEAVALPAAERREFLDSITAPAAVRDEVASLLAHADEDGTDSQGFLASPAEPARALLPPGLRLGAWEITALLGTGGMGEVYGARRADGAYEARAAVKLLRSGLDSAGVLRRFAQEQRALARLDHPHIARLLDAGRAPDGRPYFVMEQVDGQPLDRAAQGLPLRERLGLFLQLADAVAHAHRQLLLHRDLKPGNVLVTAAGELKLLDFGIAKAIDPLEADGGDATLAGERPFTPHYASPEQVRGEPVGTPTDQYSLGVLLYLLLAGQRPYGRDATTAMSASRAVLEETPAPLPAGTPYDLVLIVGRALQKTPEDRYPSVEALAADLRAHLEGRPVSVRRPSWGYLASRFVRRHRGAVAGSALAVLALVGGTAVALWQARVAEAARAAAEQRFVQVRQLANQLVFKYHDQIENLPGATKAREMLLTDAAAFLDQLRQAASDDPGLAEELAGTYYRISRLQGADQSINTGEHAAAEANLDKALALTRYYVDSKAASLTALANAVSMHVSKGEMFQRRGQMAEADAALSAGLPLVERALARDAKDGWALAGAITLHGIRARILGSQLGHASLGRWSEACASADRARAAADTAVATDPTNNYAPDSLAFTLGEQAHCRFLAGRTDEAAALFERQVGLRDQMAAKFPDDQDFRWQRAVARAHLVRLRAAQGRLAEARPLLDQARQIAQEAQAADPANAGGRGRLRAIETTQVELLLAEGRAAAARTAADGLLATWPEGAGTEFADRRPRAEALLWQARAWLPVQPSRALAAAREAQALLPPGRTADDNAARRWLWAQAVGEEAKALEALGQREPARTRAQAAFAAWHAPAADGRALPPPVPLLPWAEQARRLAGG